MPTVFCNTPGGGGGVRNSFIWPRRIRAAQQGMVFRVLRLKQSIKYYFLEQGVFFGLEPLNPTCGYQQFFKSHSMMSFIKKCAFYVGKWK